MRAGLVVIVAFAALSVSAAQPLAQGKSEDDQLRLWLAAVAQHRPGDADAAAAVVAQWSAADIERLLPDLFFYLDGVRRTERRNQPEAQFSKDERDRLLRVIGPRVPRPRAVLISSFPHPDRLNDLLLRAVSLHSDAAMLFPKETGLPLPGTPPPATNVLGAHRQEVQSADGQYVGATPVAPHWYLARALLHFTLPEPAVDAHAKRWYLAASTYLAATSEAAHIVPHFAAMRALFPDDVIVMFDLGWLAETHSTPRLQTHLRALLDAASRQAGMSGGRSLCGFIYCDAGRNPYGIKNERDSLLDAERYFARAVTLDPTLTEAHVRLAQVLTRLGRADEADSILRKLPPPEDPFVGFYAGLVQGRTLEALDKLDEAGEAYRRALSLFPSAQSANLSMSALEQRRGDTPAAALYAQRAVDPALSADAATDPMTVYHFGRGRHVREAWTAYYRTLERAQ
jgi:tetratricopeptide (TPR) repeat protein